MSADAYGYGQDRTPPPPLFWRASAWIRGPYYEREHHFVTMAPDPRAPDALWCEVHRRCDAEDAKEVEAVLAGKRGQFTQRPLDTWLRIIGPKEVSITPILPASASRSAASGHFGPDIKWHPRKEPDRSALHPIEGDAGDEVSGRRVSRLTN